MVIYHVKDLMLRKSSIEGKRLTYDIVSERSGVSKMTLSRLASQPDYNAKMDSIVKLCNYFQCTPNDLISIIPDPPERAPLGAGE